MAKRSGLITSGVAFVAGGFRGLGYAGSVCFAKEGARGAALVEINDDETMRAGRLEVEEHGTKACRTSDSPMTSVLNGLKGCAVSGGKSRRNQGR
jgi:NAD(P)-dependent dehydrogenase (short-subunit alcohol dehydrogenase family)